ncbi:MAG: endolytic transglycosylase MltG [bacterium]
MIRKFSCPRIPSCMRNLALAGLVVVMGLAYLAWIFWLLPCATSSFPRQLEVPSGKSLQEIGSLLEREGVVTNAWAFVALAVLRGEAQRIRAGIYRLEAPTCALDLLDRLVNGRVELYRVTIPEGWNLAQVAEKLAAMGLVNPGTFLGRARDPAWASELLGFEVTSLEGFLFPDTYFFPPGTTEQNILHTMVKRFQKAFAPEFNSRLLDLGWNILEAVTLASLIEKETSAPDERPLVSGVFHKRLRMGMKLESDPSVIYGLDNYNGSLRKSDLLVPHPYNTYVFRGLPPGPICNPGQESIRAALFPANTDYLFFVSKKDGTHHFSRTIGEHVRAVARYQKIRP